MRLCVLVLVQIADFLLVKVRLHFVSFFIVVNFVFVVWEATFDCLGFHRFLVYYGVDPVLPVVVQVLVLVIEGVVDVVAGVFLVLEFYTAARLVEAWLRLDRHLRFHALRLEEGVLVS